MNKWLQTFRHRGRKFIRWLRLYIRRHKWISLAALIVIIVVVFLLGRTACNTPSNIHVSGTGSVLDASLWKSDDRGFKYYDDENFVSTPGIDVSEWVEDIDFQALKKSGVEFVIFRVGYRGYETGKFVLDNNLSSYLKDARKAGLKLGAYFVSQAINEEEAIEEARYVMDHVKGYSMEMPFYIDLETVYDVARTDDLTQDDITKIAAAFCNAVEEQGYRGGIYANEVWFTDKMHFERLSQYDIWLAKYTETLRTELPVNMWQYSSEGLVDGCDMWVDLNVRISPVKAADEES